MNNYMITLIEYFNCNVVNNEKFTESEWIELNKKAMKVGYWIHRDAANSYIVKFINSKDINYNSTFYKTFNDVISKTRFELLSDQLLHYISTYGTGFSYGNGYVPNDGEIDLVSVFKNYKVIMPCTSTEMLEKCTNLINSGIALSKKTVFAVCDFIVDNNVGIIDIDAIKNREAQIYLSDKAGILPRNPISLFRYLVYKATGELMIVKNTDMYNKIKFSNTKFDLSKLDEDRLIALSTIFRRFKPLFLAMKYDMSLHNEKYINKIRRFSNKYHKPMNKNALDSIFSTEHTIDEINNIISTITTFKIISLINLCREVLSNSENIVYNIRNGKSFFAEKSHKFNLDYIKMLNIVLMDEIKRRLANKTCYVKFDKQVTLAAPTSEKNFVGNLPFGTNFELGKNNFVGIYWRNEWGTYDFDLSCISIDGNRYGWNSEFYSKNMDVIYSGDMTNADPEAAEYFYFNTSITDAAFYINRFYGNEGSKYKFIYGKDNDQNKFMQQNYICDPTAIIAETEIISDSKMQTIGLVIDSRMYITNRSVGNNITSSAVTKHRKTIMDAFSAKLKNCISINELLEYCGFVDIDTVEMVDENIDVIDFRNISKSTLIELFS